MTRPTADQLNTHLAAGGVIQVTTYTRSTLYQRKHAGWFLERGGNLYVQHGRSTHQLSIGNSPMVGIRLGRRVAP